MKFLILLFFILQACSDKYPPKDDLKNYSCTKKQLEAVSEYIKVCHQEGSYFANYCFRVANRAYCEYTYKEQK